MTSTSVNSFNSGIIPIDKFGKDHWALLDYIASVCLITTNGGVLDFRKMRCNELRHPEFNVKPSAFKWCENHGTRLAGYFNGSENREFPESVSLGLACFGHDDWDCLLDLEYANLIKIVNLSTGVVKISDIGLNCAQSLQIHKHQGGLVSEFDLKKISECSFFVQEAHQHSF